MRGTVDETNSFFFQYDSSLYTTETAVYSDSLTEHNKHNILCHETRYKRKSSPRCQEVFQPEHVDSITLWVSTCSGCFLTMYTSKPLSPQRVKVKDVLCLHTFVPLVTHRPSGPQSLLTCLHRPCQTHSEKKKIHIYHLFKVWPVWKGASFCYRKVSKHTGGDTKKIVLFTPPAVSTSLSAAGSRNKSWKSLKAYSWF